MGSDRARRSYDAGRMYRSIVSQQGRVTVEADANEAEEIRAEESRAELIDIIGPTGAPDGGFEISVPAAGSGPFDFDIGEGTLYVGGMRVRNAEPQATYLGQQRTEWVDYPTGRPAPYPTNTAPFSEAIYLAVTEQEVCAVEDAALREVALGGPDTASRTRLIQRVQRLPVNDSGCETAFSDALEVAYPGRVAFDPATMRLDSTMMLRVDLVPDPTAAGDACQPTAQTGFLGPENQLIRVQVTGDERMLWGWDNASFLYRVTLTGPRTLRLDGIPVDVYHQPSARQWVEVLGTAVDFGDGARIASAVGAVMQVDSYDPTVRTVTLDAALPADFVEHLPPQVFLRIWENQFAFAADENTATELVASNGTGTGVRVYTKGAARAPGDYWMIGVRPGMPHAFLPARLARFQSPDGPKRWAVPLALINWHADLKTAEVADCRRRFQDLVDDDLEFHNQHLHGWGVVCGLQVQCMTTDYADAHKLGKPREAVIVRDGYALHPTGADIRLESTADDTITALALGDLAVAEGTLSRNSDGKLADGTVSLWIDKRRAFHAETYVHPENPWEELLDGTILLDIYKDCILNVIKFVKGQLTPGAADGPVGLAAKRLIALMNLLWQIANQTNSIHIFISGEKDPSAPGADNEEDAILRAFFDGLKNLLQSKTFCAMFDDLVYPPYDILRSNLPANTPHPTTIFGAGMHSRIRVHPGRPLAFTCGGDGKVNVYDLVGKKLIASVDFPVALADVQDIAFAPVGNDKDIYAIAWTGQAKVDSVFVVGAVAADGTLSWNTNQVPCPLMKLVTLATSDASPGLVYAAARGLGIYQFNPGATTAPTQLSSFFATGHLVASGLGGTTVLYAGAHSSDMNPVAFDQLLGVSATPAAAHRSFALPLNGTIAGLGHDDLALVPSPDKKSESLYAIIDGVGQSKRLAIWTTTVVTDSGTQPQFVVDLGVSSSSRVAYSAAGGWSMITYENAYVGRAYRPGQSTIETEIHPLQIGPVSIATDAAGRWFYVLEYGSRTITAVPATADAASPWRSTIDLAALAKYRHGAITVFAKAIGRLAQYLKDCVCEHLLIQCPKAEGKKVYLADVSFKGGTVYQICNFHHRKYVHTFPTIEYWMSFVPILPFLKRLVELICCAVIPPFFDKLVPSDKTDAQKADLISVAAVRHAFTYLQTADLAGQFQLRKSQLSLAGSSGKAALGNALRLPSAGNMRAQTSLLEVVNKLAADAKKVAADKGLVVRNVEVASDSLSAALAMAAAPTVGTGETVDLVTDASGRVIGWRKATPVMMVSTTTAPPADTPTGAVEFGATSNEVTSLRRELSTMTEAHDKQAATVAEMQKKLIEMADTLATLR